VLRAQRSTTDEEVNLVSDKDIRDLKVSDEEGEDVKGGVKGPLPPTHNPGKTSATDPATATGTPIAAAPRSRKKAPGRMPPS